MICRMILLAAFQTNFEKLDKWEIFALKDLPLMELAKAMTVMPRMASLISQTIPRASSELTSS